MVTEKILDFLFLIADKLLSLLPELTYSQSIGSQNFWGQYGGFWKYVEMVAYLLPLNTLATIVTLVLAFSLFRIGVSVIRSVWDLLPFV